MFKPTNFKRLGIAPRSNMELKDYASSGISQALRAAWKVSPEKAESMALKFYKGDRSKAYMRLFWMLRGMDDETSKQFAIKAFEAGAEDIEAVKIYALNAFKNGDMNTVSNLSNVVGRTKRLQRLLKNVQSSMHLLEKGMPMPSYSKELGYRPLEHRALYFLHNSLPINSGGYATRAHGLLKGIHRAGFEAMAVTRWGFPHDRGNKYAHGTYAPYDIIDGVKYHRLLSKTEGMGKIPIRDYLNKNIARNGQILRNLRPSIVHGASNFINGVTANVAAKKHGVMSIYEVRGLWEITRMSREPQYEGTDAFNLYVRMETEACQSADHCFAITQALKDEMIDRGVDGDKITLVHNGVDTSRFVPMVPNLELKAKLGYAPDDVIIGYIGSIVDYEGLDYLLQAFSKVKNSGQKNLKAIIIGDGDKLESLMEMTKSLRLGDFVKFTGRIPHHDVENYYSFIDIAPFPRKGIPVCEMVSPLKPFEAMAMGKAVIVSSVAAMAEFVDHGKTGLIVKKDDPKELYQALIDLYTNPELRQSLGQNARNFVVERRDWKVLASKMTDVYQQLLDKRQWLVAQNPELYPFDNSIDEMVRAKHGV